MKLVVGEQYLLRWLGMQSWEVGLWLCVGDQRGFLIWGLPDKLLGVESFAEIYLLRDLVKDNG